MQKQRTGVVVSPLCGEGDSAFRVLLEGVNDGAAILGEGHSISYCNGRFAGILGVSRDEVLGESFLHFLSARDRGTFEKLTQVSSGERRGEVVLRTAAGRTVPAKLIATALGEGERRSVCLVVSDLSGRKQELDTVLSSMADGVLVFDAQRTITRANAAAIRALGRDPVGMSSVELESRVSLQWPDGRPVASADQPSARALRGESTSDVHVVLRRGGERVEFSVSCAPLWSGDEVTGAVGVWHDVTAVERARDALRESEQKYRSLFEHSLDGIFITTTDGRIVDANAAACEMLGMSRGEVCEAGRERLVDQTETLVAGLDERARLGRTKTELKLIRKDGTRVLAEASSAIVSKDPAAERAFVMVRDITERKRAELELRESEARLRTFFETPAVGVAELSVDGRFTAANERFCEITGYSREELLRMGPLELAPLEDADVDRTTLAAYLQQRRPTYELTKRYRRKDGRVIWVQVNAAILRGADGMPIRFPAVVQDITARKQAELELLRVKERLERAQAAARIGTFEWDISTAEPVLTSGLEAVYGVGPGELRGGYAEWLHRLHPEDLPRVEEHLNQVIAGTVDCNIEFRIQWPDGSVHWVAAVGKLERDEKGRPARITGVNMDITERKQAEVRLQETLLQAQRTTAELDAIIEAIPHAVYFGNDRTITRCNTEALRMFGAASVAELQKSMGVRRERFQIRHREDGGLVEPEELPLNKALRGERAMLDAWLTRPGGGESMRIRGHAAPVMIEGRPIGAVAVLIDITDHHRLQEALREREKHYRTLFEASPSGIVVIDPDGRIAEFNRRAHRQLGYSREEFSRLKLSDIEAGGSPAEVEERTQRALRTGGALFEARQRTKTGEVQDVVVDVRPITVAGRKRLLSVWTDITERKRIEQALRDADGNKNQFIAMLSHELRNPLAPIRNSLYILDHAAPGGEQAERARAVIQRQVAHMVRLIDDLLDVTRVSQGKIRLHRETVDLREVVRRTVEDFRLGFEAADVSLHVEAGDGTVQVDGDRTRLAQVVGNLLHNATKFTPAGGRVVVSLQVDRTTAEAVLKVCDDGVGISAQALPRLFEPFSQAEDTLARTRGGLGLGLSLVKGIVELHGGTVSAHSEGLGRGAEFCVRIPSRPGRAATDADVACMKPARRLRVLVIEDVRDTADSLREALAISGHDVAVAYNGPDGIRLARAFRPEVVLCDIGLPGMDGYEVGRVLRGEASLGNVHLIALSGFAMSEDLRRASQAGFDRHLSKPLELEELERVLAELTTRLPEDRAPSSSGAAHLQ